MPSPDAACSEQAPGPAAGRTPATTARLIDLYFMEHRAKLLDVAAFLDRVERGSDAGEASPHTDFRMRAIAEAIRILGDGRPQRARRLLEAMSDPTEAPLEAAPGKGASGAWNPSSGG